MKTSFLVPAIALGGACAPFVLLEDGGSISLAEGGRPLACIVLPAETDADEQLAAEEIRSHVRKITGAELSVGPAAGIPCEVTVYVGAALSPGLAKELAKRAADPSSFAVEVIGGKVRLAGASPEGTLFAAYEVLEQMGVRWCMPGDLGTVVPQSGDAVLRKQKIFREPSFATRLLQSVKDRAWSRRMRLGGPNYGRHGFPVEYSAAEHPEYFYEEEGHPSKKLRVSHPGVIAGVTEKALEFFRSHPSARYMSMGPDDGPGFGRDPWDADDIDPLRGEVSLTDRFVRFFNEVLAGVQKEFPEAGIAFYAYSRHMRPPVREKPNRKILPVLAPIDLCRLHAIDNPLCGERQYMKEIVSGWKALGSEMFYRGYFFNLADQGLPFSMLRQIRAEIPYFHRQGFLGMRVECMPMWMHHGPSLYLASRLMWDVDADPDEILKDYFASFYGPAADEVEEYFRVLEDAFRRADFHTGNIFDFPLILTVPVMERLEALLDNAADLAGGGIHADRVAALSLAHHYGKANLEMVRNFMEMEFEESKRHHDDAAALREKALEHDPPLLYPPASRNYFNRFWSPAVTSAYRRTTGGNELVAELPDEWLFRLDPQGRGESLAFWKGEQRPGDWTVVRTRSSSWSSQGLRYYKGSAWYRAVVDVPERHGGRRTRLWLGGVDETAKAWMNGMPLEAVSEGTAPIGKPWEFDATGAIRAGEENVIVVKVSNVRLNELGTGGLTGPAMLWAPAVEAGKDRTPL